MVSKWHQRFVTHGTAEAPRPRPPRQIPDQRVAEVVAKTPEAARPEATHWITRSMARRVGLSKTAIGRIWRTFGLQPHRTESFKLSTDPLVVDKVRDVVNLYLDPPERAVVRCVDEETQIQALHRMQPILPWLPGTPERRRHDYQRHGVRASLRR